MKVIDKINAKKPSLSFEVFPPKTGDAFDSVNSAITKIADLAPDFMSVTYGAGGGTSDFTAKIAAQVQQRGVISLAHLTCVSSSKEKIRRQLDLLREMQVENILALRGDYPEGQRPKNPDYRYAYELAAEIRNYGGFCIGGACYPEGHPESANSARDIEYLKIKIGYGCQFLTTQMFFDNNIYYNFLYRLLRAGVNVPVVAGIMPVTNAAQIKRIAAISGNTLPQKFLRIVERYQHNPEAMTQAGIAFATEQIIDLYANGVNAVHVYSMNKPDVARRIQENLKGIV